MVKHEEDSLATVPLLAIRLLALNRVLLHRKATANSSNLFISFATMIRLRLVKERPQATRHSLTGCLCQCLSTVVVVVVATEEGKSICGTSINKIDNRFFGHEVIVARWDRQEGS